MGGYSDSRMPTIDDSRRSTIKAVETMSSQGIHATERFLYFGRATDAAETLELLLHYTPNTRQSHRLWQSGRALMRARSGQSKRLAHLLTGFRNEAESADFDTTHGPMIPQTLLDRSFDDPDRAQRGGPHPDPHRNKRLVEKCGPRT